MVATLVRSVVSGPVARLELDSPANRNALSIQLLADLADAIAVAESNPAVRVLVLGHTGPAFCSGADLKEQAAAREGGRPTPGAAALAPILGQIQDCPKPVVGAIAGAARAGGVGLVAACDIAIAAESASFATGEVRLGVAPAVISVVVLPRIGRTAAARLFLTGATIGAREAQTIGLVAKVVPESDLESAVAQVVGELLQAHPNALAATKRILQEVPGMSRDEAFSAMAELSARLFASPEAAEGMDAFLERRPPDWSPQRHRPS
jgi:methylglutaconyl-CoA hydratase